MYEKKQNIILNNEAKGIFRELVQNYANNKSFKMLLELVPSGCVSMPLGYNTYLKLWKVQNFFPCPGPADRWALQDRWPSGLVFWFYVDYASFFCSSLHWYKVVNLPLRTNEKKNLKIW